MGWITRTDDELKKRGWSIAIFRAIEAAGGADVVAKEFGYRTPASVKEWYRKTPHRMPSDKINPLCLLGGGKITATEILSEM